MWKNGAYREMRKAGRTDHQARFAIGTRHARMGSDAAALFGAFKAMLTAGMGRMVRDGVAGIGLIRYSRKTAVSEVLLNIFAAKPEQNEMCPV